MKKPSKSKKEIKSNRGKNDESGVEVPVSERWLHSNDTAIKRVKKGLSEKGTQSLGSFAKHARDKLED
jgi:hypothetical protein